MFQFGRFPRRGYGFTAPSHDMTRAGFPHSDIPGSMHICCSPRLIAACRVLRRLPMPRHSPCALLCLNFSSRTSFGLPRPRTSVRSFVSSQIGCSLNCNLVTCVRKNRIFRYRSSVFAPIFSIGSFDLSSLCIQFSRCVPVSRKRDWWAQMDSNHRPRAYQARALTN